MNDDLDLIDQIADSPAQMFMLWRISPQTIGQQNILKFLHQNRQHPVGIGNGEGQPLRASIPHQPVGELVRIHPGENSNRGQRNRGDLQRQYQQRRNGGSVTAEQQRDNQQIPGLRKYAQSEKKQDESRHLRHHRRGCYQKKAANQERQVVYKPGNQAKKQVPHQQNSGIHPGNHCIVIAIGVLQHLIAQEIDGQFI